MRPAPKPKVKYLELSGRVRKLVISSSCHRLSVSKRTAAMNDAIGIMMPFIQNGAESMKGLAVENAMDDIKQTGAFSMSKALVRDMELGRSGSLMKLGYCVGQQCAQSYLRKWRHEPSEVLTTTWIEGPTNKITFASPEFDDDHDNDPELVADKQKMADLIHQTMSALPLQQRSAVFELFFNGMTEKACAKQFKMKKGAFQEMISGSMHLIKQQIIDNFGSEGTLDLLSLMGSRISQEEE